MSSALRSEAAKDLTASRLTILTGCHAGAVVTMAWASPIRVGAAADCDVVLSDAGLPEHGVTLCAERGRLKITAGDEAVGLDTGATLEPGRSVDFDFPARVRLGGDVSLLADGAVMQRNRAGRHQVAGSVNQRGHATAFAMVVVIGLALTGGVAAKLVGDAAQALPAAPDVAAAPTAGATATVPTAVLDRLDTRDLDNEVRPLLEAAGRLQLVDLGDGRYRLAGLVRDAAAHATLVDTLRQRPDVRQLVEQGVTTAEIEASFVAELGAMELDAGLETALGEGTLRVSGELDVDERGRWQQARQWYDQHYGALVPLVVDIAFVERASVPDVAVKAVWFGEEPYLVTADGARYAEGTVLAQDWQIEDIAPGGVTLRRGQRVVTLTP